MIFIRRYCIYIQLVVVGKFQLFQVNPFHKACCYTTNYQLLDNLEFGDMDDDILIVGYRGEVARYRVGDLRTYECKRI